MFPAAPVSPLSASRRPLADLARAAVGAAALLAATSASATEGYMQNGFGARQKALAGAGVASSTDATAASLNPGGLVSVDSQLNVSASFLNLNGGYSSSGVGGFNADGHHDSDVGWITVPNLAANWRVDWGFVDAVAITAYANGIINTHYKDVANANCPLGLSGVFCGGPLGLKLEQWFYSVAFAKEVLPGISLGLAPIVARQTVEAEGVSLFSGASIDPANFSNRGTDVSWGLGVRGGFEWKIVQGLRFGVAGNTPIQMGHFDKYRGLLAGQGGFDIPASLQTGIAIDLMQHLTFLADYKRIWFGSVASVGNPSTNLALFGAGNGPGFGVQDVDIIKLGFEWRQSPELTLRAGYSYNSAPVGSRNADLNIMTLGIVQHHITGGLKYQLTHSLDLEFAAMYAPRATVSGTELGNPLRSVVIDMSQVELTMGIVYRFGDR